MKICVRKEKGRRWRKQEKMNYKYFKYLFFSVSPFSPSLLFDLFQTAAAKYSQIFPVKKKEECVG